MINERKMNKNNDYLNKFFRNTQETRDEILSNKELIDALCVLLNVEKESPTRHLRKLGGIPTIRGTYTSYFPFLPGKYALKHRNSQSFPLDKIEVAVTADLFNPQLPISPFAVPITEQRCFLGYVVKDFGQVTKVEDLSRLDLGEDEIHLMRIKAQNLATILGAEKGYRFFDDGSKRQPHCIAFDRTNNAVIYNLSCFGMMNCFDFQEIIDGVHGTCGRFMRLKQIWDRLYSPACSLELFAR